MIKDSSIPRIRYPRSKAIDVKLYGPGMKDDGGIGMTPWRLSCLLVHAVPDFSHWPGILWDF